MLSQGKDKTIISRTKDAIDIFNSFGFDVSEDNTYGYFFIEYPCKYETFKISRDELTSIADTLKHVSSATKYIIKKCAGLIFNNSAIKIELLNNWFSQFDIKFNDLDSLEKGIKRFGKKKFEWIVLSILNCKEIEATPCLCCKNSTIINDSLFCSKNELNIPNEYISSIPEGRIILGRIYTQFIPSNYFIDKCEYKFQFIEPTKKIVHDTDKFEVIRENFNIDIK